MVKKTMVKGFLLALACALTSQSRAQLSGTKNIPGDYPDLATAITALNTQGVGVGGVTVNLLAANAQTAPAGGYVLGSTALNSSISATKTVTINGNNNTVTAYTGTGATDAIFTLQGTDYITINGLNLTENALNTTATTRMEWGYNFVKLNAAAPFDGCQNNMLQNCTVTLNAANPQACGVRMAHSIAGSTSVLATTGAVLADANSNNRFYGNHIVNTDSAMVFRGIGLAGVYDYNNTIGGSIAAQGNFITVGGATSAIVGGVFVANDSLITFQNNQFDISSAQTNATTTLQMIMTGFGRGNMVLRNNNFNISWAIPSPNVFTGTIYALRNDNGANPATPFAHCDPTARFVFSGNTMTGADTSVTTGTLYGVYHNYANFNVDSIYNNTFSNITWSSNARTGSGNMNLIFYNQGGRPYTTFQNNVFTNCYKLGANGNSTMLCLDNSSNQASTGLITCTNNLVQNCTSNGGLKALYTGGGIFLNNNQPVFVKYNKVDNSVANSTTTTTGGALWGIYVANGARSSEIAYDTITGCRTNAGPLNAIYKSAYADVHDCYIAYDTSTTGYVYGIYHLSGYNNGIYNNRISNLTVTGAATFNSGIIGINAPGGLGFCNIYNNSITDFNSPQINLFNALSGIAVSTNNYTSKFNIYYNTIKIAANTTGAQFGVSGVSIGDKVLGIDLRNNIINITSLPKGPGIVAAIQKIPGGNSGPSLLTTTSGNNIYYVPTAGYCYYYADGTNIGTNAAFGPMNDPNFNNSCLSTYKAFMGTKDQTSNTENNLAPVAGYAGLYAPVGLCFAESNCSPVSGITNDLLGATRPTMADIGALQFNGLIEDAYPPIISYTPLPLTTVCANVAPTLTATINDASPINNTPAGAPRMYYRKTSESDAFGGANTTSFNGWKYVTGTNTSGSTYTFTPNYSLLTAPLAGGDKITYFIVAQDVINNVGANAVAFAPGYCLTTVNLPAAAGPTNAAYARNSYSILIPVTSVLTPPAATLCTGSIMITATGTATAPTNANLGTDTTINLNNDDNTPLNGQQYNHRQQLIFKASELIAQGMTPGVVISSVAFNIAFTFGVTAIDSLNIALGNTSTNNFATGTAGGGWAASTQVFRGSVSLVNGVNTFVLNTPFTWDGTSNLVVDVVSRRNSIFWATGVYNTATPDTMNMYYNDFGIVGVPLPYDTILAHSVTNSANNFLTNMRPNVVLVYGAPKPKHWTPITSLFKNAGLTVPMTATDTNSVVYAAPAVTTSYSVVSILPGCNSAPSNPSVITPMSGFAHVIPVGAVTACDSIKLHAPPSSNVTYQWQKNGVNIAGATDSIFKATTNGTYRVFVTATGCSDTATAPAIVTIGATPVAAITGNTSGCDSVVLTDNTGTGLSYQWLSNGVPIAGATAGTYTVRNSGYYSVYARTGLGCGDTSNVITDTINLHPNPVIALNGSILSTLVLYTTYQWNRDGVAIPGATSSTYLVVRDGSYTVTVTTAAGCSGTSLDIRLSGNAVTGVVGQHGVSIYPNPASTYVYVHAPANVTIVVRDLVGRTIKQKVNTKDIYVGDVADGVYLITLTDAAGNVLLNERLVK